VRRCFPALPNHRGSLYNSPDMPTVAEQLRVAREAQGLTVHQVADITKIRTDHIRALEEGNFSVFAAPVYIRGFVRTFAGLLKLNVESIMVALDGELGQTEKFRQPPPLTSGHKGFLDVLMLQLSKVNWRVALPSLGVALLILVGFLGYRAWRQHQSKDPLNGLGPGMHQAAPAGSGNTLPLPPARK
jgi:cytoskeletal protein RodZ